MSQTERQTDKDMPQLNQCLQCERFIPWGDNGIHYLTHLSYFFLSKLMLSHFIAVLRGRMSEENSRLLSGRQNNVSAIKVRKNLNITLASMNMVTLVWKIRTGLPAFCVTWTLMLWLLICLILCWVGTRTEGFPNSCGYLYQPQNIRTVRS